MQLFGFGNNCPPKTQWYELLPLYNFSCTKSETIRLYRATNFEKVIKNIFDAFNFVDKHSMSYPYQVCEKSELLMHCNLKFVSIFLLVVFQCMENFSICFNFKLQLYIRSNGHRLMAIVFGILNSILLFLTIKLVNLFSFTFLKVTLNCLIPYINLPILKYILVMLLIAEKKYIKYRSNIMRNILLLLT